MEQRPQHFVRVAVVVQLELALAQIDRGVGDAVADVDIGLAGLLLDRLAAPAEPQSAGALQRAEDADREPAGRRGFTRQRIRLETQTSRLIQGSPSR